MKFSYTFIIFSLTLPPCVIAQTTNNSKNYSSVKATDFIGKTVKNRRGETLGKIEEIVFTPQGSLEYAVIATGGVLGMGESHVPVPYGRLQIKPKDNIAYLEASKEDLQNAPAIAKENWSINDSHWRQAADVYFALDSQDLKIVPAGEVSAQILPDFKKFDTNKDGYIDQNEVAVAPQLNQQFHKLDADADRRLNEIEFSAFELK